jgi:hypothetical protein
MNKYEVLLQGTNLRYTNEVEAQGSEVKDGDLLFWSGGSVVAAYGRGYWVSFNRKPEQEVIPS